jgi:cellulose synthase/poly-beta-1,6-N-acetylglucosamine synthase-like glycosyltransferase
LKASDVRILRSGLVAISAFVLVWPLAGYPALLWLIGKLRRHHPPPRPTDIMPSMTVVVPTYMEHANITARLENIAECRYPSGRLEVLVVDSASGDGTADLADAHATAHPGQHVRVMREPVRAGKASAINFALQHARGELILVTDAPTRFHPDALALIASNFSDPAIGAATGRFDVFEQRTATQREESLFWRIRNALRELEAAVDSTPFLSGEFCCFRRGVVDRLDTDTIADDMNVAMRARRAGYRSIVDSRALFTEPRSPEVGDLLVRKVSRAAGGIQELLRNRDMMLRREYGLFGMLILPSDMLYYLPLRLPALAVLGAAAISKLRRRHAAIALLAALPLAASGPRRKVADAAYVIALNEWLFVRGWQTVLAGKMEVLWEKESRQVVPRAAWEQPGQPRRNEA